MSILTAVYAIFELNACGDRITAIKEVRGIVKHFRPNIKGAELDKRLIELCKESMISKTEQYKFINLILYRRPVWGKCEYCGKKVILGYDDLKTGQNFEYDGDQTCCFGEAVWEC